jgi:SAM-dependent methyltransferase
MTGSLPASEGLQHGPGGSGWWQHRGVPLKGLHQARSRASSFGACAREYERFRSGYPDALVQDLLSTRPSRVLDIGTGTGKVAVAIAARGVSVLGVDPDERMAAVARARGVDVEVASFETWDSRDRRYDLITCGHAWQWVDPAVGAVKAASLLRPGGVIALFWNYHVLSESVLEAVRQAYEAHAAELAVVGEDPTLQADSDPFTGIPSLTAGEPRTYRWRRVFTAYEWAGMVATFSDHQELSPARLAALQHLLRRIIQQEGGTVEAHGGTYAWFAAKVT